MGTLPKKMKYDYQIVLALVPGGANKNDDNKGAYENARRLTGKRQFAGDAARTNLVAVTEVYGDGQYPDLSKFRPGFAVPRLRVYVVGHGHGESSNIGGLKAEALAQMLKTLNSPIAVLGLVACYSGYENLKGKLPIGRPAHSLARSLYDLVKSFVTEIHAYTGEVAVSEEMEYSDEPAAGRVAWDDPTAGRVYVENMEAKKAVKPQKVGDRTLPRKVIVNAGGLKWDRNH